MSDSRHRPYVMSAGRLQVRFTPSDRQDLEEYASAQSLPLARAVIRLVRAGLTAEREHPAAPASTSVDQLHFEVSLHTLVAVEQVLRLQASMVRGGPGAADAALYDAGAAAQRRITVGTLPEVAR